MTGAVRVLINEDAIRARERSAAGQQLSAHINDILLGQTHQRSSGGFSQGGGASSSSPGRAKSLLSFKSIPSGVHAAPWPSDSHPQPGRGFFGGDSGSCGGGGFMSGPVRGWPAAGGEVASSAMRRAMLMQQQQWPQALLQQQQQQQWPLDPLGTAGLASGGGVAASALQQQAAEAQALDSGAQAAAAAAEVAACSWLGASSGSCTHWRRRWQHQQRGSSHGPQQAATAGSVQGGSSRWLQEAAAQREPEAHVCSRRLALQHQCERARLATAGCQRPPAVASAPAQRGLQQPGRRQPLAHTLCQLVHSARSSQGS